MSISTKLEWRRTLALSKQILASCFWSGRLFMQDVAASDGMEMNGWRMHAHVWETKSCRLHKRRIWALDLVLISVQWFHLSKQFLPIRPAALLPSCLVCALWPSRGSDSEGEWREHHWEDLLPSDSLDPEQVNLSEILLFCSVTVSFNKNSNSHDASQLSDVAKPFSSALHIVL